MKHKDFYAIVIGILGAGLLFCLRHLVSGNIGDYTIVFVIFWCIGYGRADSYRKE